MSATVAIVAGGGGPLGHATAVALAADGLTVVAVDRTEHALSDLPEDIRREVADATGPAEAARLIDRIAGEAGPPDALVNTIGAFRPEDVLATTRRTCRADKIGWAPHRDPAEPATLERPARPRPGGRVAPDHPPGNRRRGDPAVHRTSACLAQAPVHLDLDRLRQHPDYLPADPCANPCRSNKTRPARQPDSRAEIASVPATLTKRPGHRLAGGKPPSPGCMTGSGLTAQGPHDAVCGDKGHHFRVADGHAPAGTPSGGACAGSFSTPSAVSTSDHKSSRSRLTFIG